MEWATSFNVTGVSFAVLEAFWQPVRETARQAAVRKNEIIFFIKISCSYFWVWFIVLGRKVGSACLAVDNFYIYCIWMGYYGIMSIDIIPVLICRPTKEDSFPGKSCVSPKGVKQ